MKNTAKTPSQHKAEIAQEHEYLLSACLHALNQQPCFQIPHHEFFRDSYQLAAALTDALRK